MCAAAVGLAAAAQQYEPLTSFPDAKFQEYLKTTYKTALSSDGKSIDVLPVDKIAFTSTTYKTIKSLEGIKKLVNLKYLYLPGKSSSTNDRFNLQKVDVSGMQNLEIIDSGTFIKCSSGNSANIKYVAVSSECVKDSYGKFIYCDLQSLVADDCPKLKYVAITTPRYDKFTHLSLNNCPNLEALYIPGADIETLDLSGFPKLTNLLRTATTTNGAYSTVSNNLNKTANIVLYGLSKLKSVNVGNHPDVKFMSVHQCGELETLDISGMTGLTDFSQEGVETVNSKSIDRGGSKLSKLIMADNYPNMASFSVKQNSLRELDITPFCKTVTSFRATGGYLTSLDLTQFPRCSAFDVSYNHIWHLDLPPMKTLYHWNYKGNKITYLPIQPSGTNYQSGFSNTVVAGRNVGQVMKYKVFDDANYYTNVMMADDTSSPKRYYAPTGGHIGVATDGEDPRYFYFDDSSTNGVYWFKNTTNNAITSYCQVTLSRTTPDEFDPHSEQFWLALASENFVPRDVDKFVLTDEETGMYELNHAYDVSGEFRIVNAADPAKVTLSFGGHEADKYLHGQEYHGGNHVFFAQGHFYQLGQDPDIHFTTHPAEVGTWEGTLARPQFVLSYHPARPNSAAKAPASRAGEPSHNYIAVTSATLTDVDGVEPATEDGAEYYTLQGIRTLAPVRGNVYIRVDAAGRAAKVAY